MMKSVAELKLLIFWMERALMGGIMILMSFPSFGRILSPFFLIITFFAFLHLMGHAYVMVKKYQKKELDEPDDDLFFLEKIGIFFVIIYLITGHVFALIVVTSTFLVTNTFYYVLSAHRAAVVLAPGEKTEEEKEDLKAIKLGYEKSVEEFKELKEELYENWILERSELLGKMGYYEECCNSYNEELYEVMLENRRLSETVEEYKRRCINMSPDNTFQSFNELEEDFIMI